MDVAGIVSRLQSAAAKMRAVLTLRAGETSSAAGRSRERYRRAAITSLTAVATKGINIGASLITIPLTLRYLGAERNGMWLSMSSTVLMLASADLGIGLGLVNVIADSIGRDDREEARRAASSAFWMLAAIALLVLVGFAIAYPLVPWNRIFNVQSATAIHESGPTLMVFFACFAVNLPVGVVYNIQTGLQKGYVNNQWSLVGSLLSLSGLLLAIHLHAGLPVLILAISGAPLLALMMNGVQLFFWGEPGLRPSLRYLSLPTARRLLRTGLLFFVLGLCLAVAYQSDNFVITRIMGARAVNGYALPARLFNIVASLLVLLSGSMWPAYADAKARSDAQWIRRSFVRTVKLGTGLSAVITLVLMVFGNRILALWVGPEIRASALLLAVFGVRCVLNAYLQPINLLLNGLNELRSQTILMVIMAAVNITLSIWFVRLFGVVGAVLGTVVAEAVVLVVPMTVVVNRTLKRLETA